MPASVVGTCTTRTPRSQAAATQPARSVVAPPPRPTTASERVKPSRPNVSQHEPATGSVLAASPSGTSIGCACSPCIVTAARTDSATAASVGGWMTATRVAAPSSAGSSASSPRPTNTS